MAPSSSAQIVPRILQRGPHALITAKGRADPAHCADRRSDVGCAHLGRPTPPIYPSVSFRQGQQQTWAQLSGYFHSTLFRTPSMIRTFWESPVDPPSSLKYVLARLTTRTHSP